MPSPNSRGFTLLEALVALIILGTAILAGAELLRQSLWTQERAEGAALGAAVADWKLSELAALPADSLRHFDGPATGQVTSHGRLFVWRSSIAPDSTRETLWHAAVTVEWERGSLSLGTGIFRPLHLGGVLQ